MSPRTGGPILQVQGLVKHFAQRGWRRSGRSIRAVDGVDLFLNPGETLGIVGESGCGKTTLGRIILGLLEPDAGNIRLDGVDITHLRGSSRRNATQQLQAVFQDPAGSLNPRLRVGQSIAEPLRARHWDRAKIRERVAELLPTVELKEEMATRWPHQFSGGQRQRIGIARAIASQPQVIIADEPTSALDVSVRAQIMSLLSQLQRDLGMSFLLISHDLAVVRHYSQRIAVMYAGKIVEEGDTEAITRSPRHPYTQRLLASVPSLDPAKRFAMKSPQSTDAAASAGLPDTGCPYAPRCPLVEDQCRLTMPLLVPLAQGNHRVACHVAARNHQSS